MPSLYALTNEVQQVLSLIGPDGEIPADLEQRIDALNLSVADKIESLCRWRQNEIAEAEAIAFEIQRLERLLQPKTNLAERIKKWLYEGMVKAGIDRIDVPMFKLWIQNNGRPSIEVREGAAVPEQYRRIKVELDGQAAYEAWKAGKELPPQLEVKLGKHIRIK